MIAAAGAAADGLVGHPIATRRWHREVTLPGLRAGERSAGRREGACALAPYVITSIQDDREAAIADAKNQIGFYFTTGIYHSILDLHGLRAVGDACRAALRTMDTKAMAAAVPDALVEEIAIACTPDEARDRLALWKDLTDQPLLYAPTVGVPRGRLQDNLDATLEIFGQVSRSEPTGRAKTSGRRVSEAREPLRSAWDTTKEDPGKWAQKRRLADAMRLVIERLMPSDAPEAELRRAADALEAYADALEAHPRLRYVHGYAESANAGDVSAFFDRSPMIGLANPLAPPITIAKTGERTAEGRVVFGSAYEGPPGHVHGGFVAAAFDEVLGFVQSLSGRPGMTGTLIVRYRRPTPLHTAAALHRRVPAQRGAQALHRGARARGRRAMRRGRGHLRLDRARALRRARERARRARGGSRAVTAARRGRFGRWLAKFALKLARARDARERRARAAVALAAAADQRVHAARALHGPHALPALGPLSDHLAQPRAVRDRGRGPEVRRAPGLRRRRDRARGPGAAPRSRAARARSRSSSRRICSCGRAAASCARRSRPTSPSGSSRRGRSAGSSRCI